MLRLPPSYQTFTAVKYNPLPAAKQEQHKPLSTQTIFLLSVLVCVFAVAVTITLMLFYHIIPLIHTPSNDPQILLGENSDLTPFDNPQYLVMQQQLIEIETQTLGTSHPRPQPVAPLGGYTAAVYAQPSPVGTAAGLPSSFAVNTTGVFMSQGWGVHIRAALQRSNAPARVYFFGDSQIASPGTFEELRRQWQLRWGDGGEGWITPLNSRCALQTGSGYSGYTMGYGRPGGVIGSLGTGAIITCNFVRGSSFRLWYSTDASTSGGYSITVNGAAISTSGMTMIGTTGVQHFDFTSVSSVNNITLTALKFGTFHGIEAWYPRQGIVLFNWGVPQPGCLYSCSGNGITNVISVEQWQGVSDAQKTSSFATPDLIVFWFMLMVDNGSGMPASAMVTLADSVLNSTVSGTNTDVVWIWPVTNGGVVVDTFYSPMVDYAHNVNPRMAIIRLGAWLGMSYTLLNNLGGYLPCSSTNKPSASNWCWNQPTGVYLSDIGVNLTANVFAPILMNGFYTNSGVWPYYPPSTPWPIPVSSACTNRPAVPMTAQDGATVKKGIGILPDSSPPLLYDCRMLNLPEAKWYYNWQNTEYCANTNNVTMPWTAMAFGEWDLPFKSTLQLDRLPSITESPFLMAWNEPDIWWESGVSPVRTAELWPLFENTGRILLSPGPSQPDSVTDSVRSHDAITWMTAWNTACQQTLGRPCQYDFINVHYYTCSMNELITRLALMYNLLRKQIWLTEFGCGISADENLSFTTNMFAYLEASPMIYRYAWYALRTIAAEEWIPESLFDVVNNHDYAIYLGQLDRSTPLSVALNTLNINTLGLHYQSIPSVYPGTWTDQRVTVCATYDDTMHTDPLGYNWMPDTGMLLSTGAGVYQVSVQTMNNTNDSYLYQCERVGPSTLNYAIVVRPGHYYGILFAWAEVYFSGPGLRVFDIYTNGVLCHANFDIFSAAGGADTAVHLVCPPQWISSDMYNFTLISSVDHGKVNSFVIFQATSPTSYILPVLT